MARAINPPRIQYVPSAYAVARTGGWGGWWIGWPGWEGAYTENYDQGALYIAALDPKTKRMIWVGAAQARLLPRVSYERSLARIDEAVKRVLEKFPKR